MAINDFKPIAFAALATVTPQVTWAGSSKQLNGFPTGQVARADMNKALRQASVMGAALAETIKDVLNEDVLDNGDFAARVTQIKTLLGVLEVKRGGIQKLTSATRLWAWQRDTTPVYSSPIIITNYVIRAGGVIGGAVTFSGAVVLFGGYDGYVYCVQLATGTELWRTAVGGAIYGRVQAHDIDGDTLLEIVAADQGGRITLLRCDGSVWHTGKTNRALNSAYVRDGGRSQPGDAFTPYLTATNGGLNYVELAGATWAPKAFMRTTPAGAVIHDDIEILNAGGTAVVDTKRILDVTTSGTPRITVDTNFSVAPIAGTKFRVKPNHSSDYFFMHAGTISVEGGVPYLYQTGFDHHLVKYNLATQAVVWKQALGGDIELFPSVLDVDNDTNLEVVTICLGGILTTAGKENAHVSCWNATTGALKWATDLPTGSVSSMLVAQIDGTSAWSVLVGQQNGQMIKVRGSDGVVLESSTTLTDSSFNGVDSVPMKIGNGGGADDLLVGSDAGFITRMDAFMDVKWQQRFDAVFNSSPIMLDVNGDGQEEILIADMSGMLMILTKDGGFVGAIFTKGGIEGIPAVSDFNGDGRYEILIPTLLGRLECWQFTES